MSKDIERRMIPFNYEIREADGKLPELVGHASVFNQETVIEGWWDDWREEVAPGAFKKTIQEADIRALFNHDPNVVLGRNKSGTLDLSEDEIGLLTVIRPPDNAWGNPVMDAVRRGDISGMSIAFSVVKEEVIRPEKKGSNELPKRIIREAKLYDVSVVTYPAFEQTDVSARSQAGRGDLQDDMMTLAGMISWKAQFGQALTAEERERITKAVEILRDANQEPAMQSHSPQAASDEPDVIHSDEARARRLRLVQLVVKGN